MKLSEKKKERLHTNLILANRYFKPTDLHNLGLSTNVTPIFTDGRSKIFTIVPLGSATIISTGKLYFSKCNRAFSLNAWFCSSAWLQEEKKTIHWEQGREKWRTLHQFKAHISTVTCRLSSSLTRDQLLTKLSLSRARTGELSRTVSRRVRPEPTEGKMDNSAGIGVLGGNCLVKKWSHLSRTGHLMPPRAGWNAPVFSLLQLVQRPLRKAGRTPGKERMRGWLPVLKSAACWVNAECLPSWKGRKWRPGVETLPDDWPPMSSGCPRRQTGSARQRPYCRWRCRPRPG